MAITYLNSNIIKMYYGGNEIKQAYLNGDHFFSVNLFNAYTATIENGDHATASIIDSTNISTTTSGTWGVVYCEVSGLTPNQTYRLTTTIENPSGMYGGIRDKSSSQGGTQSVYSTDISFEASLNLVSDSNGTIHFEFYPNYTSTEVTGTMTYKNIKLVEA